MGGKGEKKLKKSNRNTEDEREGTKTEEVRGSGMKIHQAKRSSYANDGTGRRKW
jgi:hypothetical protein